MKSKPITPPLPTPGEAAALLYALCEAGCNVFIDDQDDEDDRLYCSPPARAVAWPGNERDWEAAISRLHDEMRAIVLLENQSRPH